MGSKWSRKYSIKSTKLYDQIKETVRELIYKYEFWSNEEICDKLALVYYDKLIQFNTSDLVDASAYIGIRYEDEVNKEELCEKIINHYMKRLELLKKIWDALEDGYEKLTMAIEGPICKNVDKYVKDFFTCQKMGGLWLSEEQYKKIINNLKEMDLYNEWENHIENLENKWNESLNKLNKIIKIIKQDIDNTIDDKIFDEIKEKTERIIKRMKYICDIYYLLAINYS